MIGTAGAAWPYRFVSGVFAKLLDAYNDRLSIETNTPVLKVAQLPEGQHPYSLSTPRGALRTKNVVYCTEAHTAHLIPDFRGLLVPRRGHMSVQKPGTAFSQLRGKRSWNFLFDLGHDYLHQNPKTGDIFLGGGDLGGFDNGLDIFGVASDAVESLTVKSHLTGILPTMFGKDAFSDTTNDHQRMKATWCGTLGYSLDHVPIVGPLPREILQRNGSGKQTDGKEWICAGFGGFGMTNSWLCGKALALQIMGQPIPAWLPDPYRLTPTRMYKLRKRLEGISGTKDHLRALM